METTWRQSCAVRATSPLDVPRKLNHRHACAIAYRAAESSEAAKPSGDPWNLRVDFFLLEPQRL